MPNQFLEVWDIWYPKAAATGLPFARGRCAHTTVMLVHAAPAILSVKVVTEKGQIVVQSEDLQSTDDAPVTRLTVLGPAIKRENIWLTDQDLGTFIILPGGEIGTLKAWWNAADHSEWRWTIELYNHR